MNFDILLKELNKLELPIGEYAITSSGPLGIRGIRESNDLDVIVTKTQWKKLVTKYPVHNQSKIAIGNIDLSYEGSYGTNKIGPSIEDQISSAEIIKGYPFVKLETIKFFKTKSNRKKDKLDLELIRKFETNESNLAGHWRSG